VFIHVWKANGRMRNSVRAETLMVSCLGEKDKLNILYLLRISVCFYFFWWVPYVWFSNFFRRC